MHRQPTASSSAPAYPGRKTGTPRSPSSLLCFRCGIFGHISRGCSAPIITRPLLPPNPNDTITPDGAVASVCRAYNYSDGCHYAQCTRTSASFATVATKQQSVTSPSTITSSVSAEQTRLWAHANLTIPDITSPPATPYIIPLWKEYLENHPDPTSVAYHLNGLRQPLASEPTHQAHFRQPFLGILTPTYNIVTELLAKRYLGPSRSLNDIPPEFHPFRNAPLGVIPQKTHQPS